MLLKSYQEKAINKLLEQVKELLPLNEKTKLVFKAPTGSGKTIVMAELLKKLSEDVDMHYPISYIWTAPRQLHLQSKKKLDSYFQNTQALKCSDFEDLSDKKIDQNEILFFNWESINKEDNIYIRDNEYDLNLSNILQNTREEGRKIVLIIDESHYSADAPAANKLRQDIDADLTIEVSATPVLDDPDEQTNIRIEDVKSEGMIKKGVILNEKFRNILIKGKVQSELSKGSEDFVIKQALDKKKEIEKAYQNEDVKINPLILIQLPDRKTNVEEAIKEKVIQVLKSYDITTENGRLAIWLSGEHVNKDEVERPDSEVDVLIFKQAIALGWDCPRAQILVLFREWHSPIFSIQTVGRVMRMPEPDRGHYKNDLLNFAYVYTNLGDIEIKEDIARNYITIHSSYKIKDCEAINLLSCHSKRQREKTRLSPRFITIFLQLAEELKVDIDIRAKKETQIIISDWHTQNINLTGAGLVREKVAEYKTSSFDLQKSFDFFVRQNLSPFHPEDRSIGRVKEAIYALFQKKYGIAYQDKQEEIIQIVLEDTNKSKLITLIHEAKQRYIKEVEKIDKELVFDKDWNIPDLIRFNETYILQTANRSVMQPFYTDNRWESEKAFIEFLERSNQIVWWFKNGDSDGTYFALSYTENNEEKPFYVDFIVLFKNGSIGLFDTKGTLTMSVAKPKIDGIYKYIQEQSKKSKKIFGGIVINTDNQNYKGRWLYFDKTSDQLIENEYKNWITFSL